jgi:pimeloyl-ACP methyl ester carboxylesterase
LPRFGYTIIGQDVLFYLIPLVGQRTHVMHEDLIQHRMTSFDGTHIAYYLGGRADGPAVVISAGLGGGLVAWRHIIEDLAPDYRLICWDYRGLFKSGPAVNAAGYAIENHARDLKCLLEHLGITQPVLLGWSMGVQVNFEACLSHWIKPSGLVAIHGTPGRPIDTALNSGLPKRVAPLIFSTVRKTWRLAMKPAPRMVNSDRMVQLIMLGFRGLGWMDKGMSQRDFQDMARDWIELDLEAYTDIFDALGRHDTTDRLPTLETKTLVVAGSKDKFTPNHLSTTIERLLPNAELVMVPSATHFGLMEHPVFVCGAVRNFIDSL